MLFSHQSTVNVVNLDVREFNISWSHILIYLFLPFVICFEEFQSDWLLYLPCYCTAHCQLSPALCCSTCPAIARHTVSSVHLCAVTLSHLLYSSCWPIWQLLTDMSLVCQLQSCSIVSRSQWPRGLRRGSAAARLLGFRVRIPSWAWMSVCCDCCVLWCRCLCVGPITRLEDSYRVRCVRVWYRNWAMRRPTRAVELWQEIMYCDCQEDLFKATHRESCKRYISLNCM